MNYPLNSKFKGPKVVISVTISTTPYTLDEKSAESISVNATSSAITVNLPPIASVTGRSFTLRKTDSSVNVVNIVADGSELIENLASISLTSQWQSVTLENDGTKWFRVGTNSSGGSAIPGTADGQVIFVNSSLVPVGDTLFKWDSVNKRLGVGVATPLSPLHVVGDVRFTGALLPNGLAGTAGQVLTSAGAGLPPTWGAGGGSSQWTTTGSDIYYDTGNVAIGSSSVGTDKLNITGSLGVTGNINGTTATFNNAGSSVSLDVRNNSTTNAQIKVFAQSSSGISAIEFDQSNGTNRMLIGFGQASFATAGLQSVNFIDYKTTDLLFWATSERARFKSGGDVAFNTNTLYVDAANSRVGVNVASPTRSLDVRNAAATSTVGIRNTNAAGLSTVAFEDEGGNLKGTFGWDNSNDILYWQGQGTTPLSFLIGLNTRLTVSDTVTTNFTDFFVSADGSSTGAPRIIGFNNFSSGEALRLQFGGLNEGIQTSFGSKVQLYAFHGMEIIGARAISGTPPSFVGGSGVNDNPLSIINVTGASHPLNLETYSGGAVTTTNLTGVLFKSARGTQTSPTAVTTDDVIGEIQARGYHSGGGFSATPRVQITMAASQAWTNTNQGTYASIKTTPNNSTVIAERVKIDQDGRSYFTAAASGVDTIVVKNTASDGFSTVNFLNNSGTNLGAVGVGNSSSAIVALRGKLALHSNNTDIAFATTGTVRATISNTNGDFAVDTDTLYVDATNNRVGIGTATPSFTFEMVDDTLAFAKFRNTDATKYVDLAFYDDTDTWVSSIGYGNASAGDPNYAGRLYIQTESQFVISQGADINSFVIDTNGSIGLGTDAPIALLDITRTGTATTGLNIDITQPTASISAHNVHILQSTTDAGLTLLNPVYAWAETSGTGNRATGLCIEGDVYHGASGTMDLATGVAGYVENSGSGVITTAYALHSISPVNSGAGSIGTAVGLQIDEMVAGTTRYAIYYDHPTNPFSVNGDGTVSFNSGSGVARVAVPATATSTGMAGTVAWDSSFFYVCSATDTWRRVAVASW